MIGGDVAAAAGDFDASFAQGGIVRLSGDLSLPTDGQATSITVDGAGKLLVTGFDNQKRAGVFARVFPSGSLDPGFAGKGFMLLPAGPMPLYSFREPTQAFPLSNGNILLIERVSNICFGSAGGCSVSNTVLPRNRATRISGDGIVDVTYNGGFNGGETPLSFAPTNISLELDGALTVIGVQNVFPAKRMFLARYDASGKPDTSFSQDAVAASINCGAAYTLPPVSMLTARHSNNRLLVAQQFKNGVTQSNDICITRLNQDGSRDTTFGTGGQMLVSDAGLANHFPFKFLIRSDGGINVLLLNGAPKLRHQPAIIWLTANGALDTTRGSLGVTNPVVGAISSITAATLQTDDKILFVGYGASPGNVGAVDETAPRIARQDARGAIDFSFGSFRGGYANLYSGTTRFAPSDVIIAPDGGIYLAGGAGDSNLATPTAIAVAKLLGDPAPVSPPADVGGGGCGFTRNGPIDPMLPTILSVAAWYLFGRRRIASASAS